MSRVKRPPPLETQERTATLHWMYDVSHAIGALGWSFGKVRREGPADADGAENDTRIPPIMVLCTDQEATQLAAAAYLKNKKRMFVEHVSDPAHRSHNDTSSALSAAGLLKFSVWCVSLYNLRYGPWNKGGWSRRIQETADNISKNMDASDPVLLQFFPEILADADLAPDLNTEDYRREWLRGLPSMDCVRTKGPKASTGRFNSITTSHSALDKEWSVLAFVLVVVCLETGWMKNLAALQTKDRATQASAEIHSGSRTKAKAEAKADIEHDRQGKGNKLNVLTKFICSPDNKNTARLMHHVLQPEELRCSRMLCDLRSPDETLRIYAGWSHWSWMETAREVVARWSDLRALARIGFDVDVVREQQPTEEEMLWQDALAGNLVSLAGKLLRYRAGSQLFYTNGFGATAGLVHPDPAYVANSLRFFQDCSETMDAVHANGSLRAKQMMSDHPFCSPLSQHVLAELRSTSFRSLTPRLHTLLTDVWSGLLNTKIIEDCNKVQREAEQRNSNAKDLGRLAGWRAVTANKLVEAYRRTEIRSDVLYHVPVDFKAAALFKKSSARHLKAVSRRKTKTSSAAPAVPAAADPDDELLRGVTKLRDWSSHNHTEEQEVLAAFSVLSKAHRMGNRWCICEHAWIAGLLPQGHAVLAGEPGEAVVPLYIVRTYRLAALCWPGKLVTSGGKSVLRLHPDAPSLYWYHTQCVDVKLLELRAASPLRAWPVIFWLSCLCRFSPCSPMLRNTFVKPAVALVSTKPVAPTR